MNKISVSDSFYYEGAIWPCRICKKPASRWINVHGDMPGKNLSPLSLTRSWEDVCDEHLEEVLMLMQFGMLVGRDEP